MKVNKAYRYISVDEKREELEAGRPPKPEPESIIVNQRGDIEKTYRLRNGEPMLCIEPPPEKWRVQEKCRKLRGLEANIRRYIKEYEKEIEALRQLETELKLCVLYPYPQHARKQHEVAKEQIEKWQNNLDRYRAILIHGNTFGSISKCHSIAIMYD